MKLPEFSLKDSKNELLFDYFTFLKLDIVLFLRPVRGSSLTSPG